MCCAKVKNGGLRNELERENVGLRSEFECESGGLRKQAVGGVDGLNVKKFWKLWSPEWQKCKMVMLRSEIYVCHL